MIHPRPDRLCWEDYHMLRAIIASWRSPDPNTQVGACLVNKDNRPLGEGYNGAPRGMDVCSFNWARTGDYLETKYPFVVHAEKNAISNAIKLTTGCRIYCTLYPCNECSKDIVQAGISELIYLTNPYKEQDSCKASKYILEASGVKTRKHKWTSLTAVQKYLKKLLTELTS